MATDGSQDLNGWRPLSIYRKWVSQHLLGTDHSFANATGVDEAAAPTASLPWNWVGGFNADHRVAVRVTEHGP